MIYGAGGSIGGAVARAFAREGARLFLAGVPWQSSTRWPGTSPPREERPRPLKSTPSTSRPSSSTSPKSPRRLGASTSRSMPSGWKMFRELRSSRCRWRISLARSPSPPHTVLDRQGGRAAHDQAGVGRDHDDHRDAGTHGCSSCRRLQRGVRRHGEFVPKPGGGAWAEGRPRHLPAFGRIAGVHRRGDGCSCCRSQSDT